MTWVPLLREWLLTDELNYIRLHGKIEEALKNSQLPFNAPKFKSDWGQSPAAGPVVTASTARDSETAIRFFTTDNSLWRRTVLNTINSLSVLKMDPAQYI